MSEQLETEASEVPETEKVESNEVQSTATDSTEDTGDNTPNVQELMMQLAEAKKEAETASADRDKWKQMSRKNEEEKKQLLLASNRARILDQYNLPKDAIDLLGSGNIQEQEQRAEILSTILKGSNSKNAATEDVTPTPLQGVSSETTLETKSAEYKRYLALIKTQQKK